MSNATFMSRTARHLSGDHLGDILLPMDRGMAPKLMADLRGWIAQGLAPATLIELSAHERLRPQLGPDAARVYLIEHGVVVLEHYSPRGRRTILDVLPPNDFFGEDSMPGIPEQYNATALSDVSLICLRHDIFQSLIASSELNQLWRLSLNMKVRRHRSFLLRFATSDCETRLALALFDLAHTFGVNSGPKVRIDLRLRHEDYAAMVGTTRSRVGLFLQRFEERNMLQRNRYGQLLIAPGFLVSYIMERMGLTPNILVG